LSLDTEFDTFWQQFPRHVGKLAAKKAYQKARKQASAEDILNGIERYRRAKPAYADWCHPATFLNQGRWMDEDDRATVEWVCPHTPSCLGRHACYVKQQIAAARNGQ
jgi:hypothetical protein